MASNPSAIQKKFISLHHYKRKTPAQRLLDKMENQYIKQFPDLMQGKRIMYIHGFGSSAHSGTVELLKQLLPSAEIIARDIPLHPEEAIEMLKAMCEKEQPALIIGTSMGGMYAEQLYGYDRILVNPAFQMGETMAKHGMIGKQTFQNPRTDGIQEFIVTKALVKEYAEMTSHCFSNVTEEERQHVVGMFGDADPVVHTFDLFREHYSTAIHFHGEHRLTDKIATHYLIPTIRRIDDKQEQRQRPIVYIDIQTLKDSYGHATASMHKAYEFLLEAYDIYIVAPAPTNDHTATVRTQEWVEEYLSAPAYDHVVFTNQKQFLLGDYYIGKQNVENFLGTSIVWGSSDFKTWEEIITYFDRLGGQ